MKPLQRCNSAFSRLLPYRAALCLALALSPASALAQQVFIKHIWVQDPTTNCFILTTNGSPNGTFACNDGSSITCNGVATPSPNYAYKPSLGNISNDPHIEFDNTVDPGCAGTVGALSGPGGPLLGDLPNNVCRKALFLCMKVGWANQQSGNSTFALDSVSFEVFKFAQGSNPLDPSSTPPLRTFFVDSPGIVAAGTNSNDICSDALIPAQCVLWDGSINIQGELGKSNGQYGFRATVATNQTGASGNINITQTRAYPSEATIDANTANTCGGFAGTCVEQKPITVDVVNVHVVRTSPTVVGQLTGVAAEPYNVTYRISKDANTTVSIINAGPSPASGVLRTLVPNLPRVGEGVPTGTLQNGDSWNGRGDNGDLFLPGMYMAQLFASANDQYGADTSATVTRQISVDPLQITDILVQPLTDQSTSLAVLSYLITEPGTVFVDIYPPGTQFGNGTAANCHGQTNPLNNINNGLLDNNGINPKDFCPQFNGIGIPTPLRHIQEQKDFRKSVITFWDGRDQNGNILPDGDYVFVLYASLPSQNGLAFLGNVNDRRIWADNAKSGFLTVSRGLVTISQIGPSSTVIGSSPPVAGLDPFTFSYSMSRDSNVTLKILKAINGNDPGDVVRTLVNNQQRPGNFLNRERWYTPVDDNGLYLSSGNYLAQLTVSDPFVPSKVSTTTALFPINLFRITDVFTSPLLTGATDVITLSYQLSQPMNVVWNIYPPGTVLPHTPFNWPPCGALQGGLCGDIVNAVGTPMKPIITISGARPGRLRITEFWDGRDPNGIFVPDGTYVYTLVAQSSTTPQYFAADQVFGTLTVARGSIIFPIFNVTPTIPTLFNSSQTVALPPYEIDYSLTRQSSVTVQVLNTNPPFSVVRTIISGQVRDPIVLNREFWDARDDSGNFVPQGFYTVRATAQDLASALSSGSTAQQTISVDPLRIYDVAISPLKGEFKTGLVAYQVSETMKVAIKIYKPGTTFSSNLSPFATPTPPEPTSLVKRIVGVRPARTEITDSWDGTDLKLSMVPDGNYVFRIVASTDIKAIDNGTGNVAPGSSMAEDVITAEIPVVRNGSLDPLTAFSQNSFVYPNPLTGASGTFQIYVPVQADVSLKIYNIAGELVLDQHFGSQLADSYVNFVWAKTNQAGRQVAHGVYFMLIREEPNLGEKTPLQIVKKILIP